MEYSSRTATRMQGGEFEIYVHQATPKGAAKKPLTSDGFETLKHCLRDAIVNEAGKIDSLVTLSFKGRRFLSSEQAEELITFLGDELPVSVGCVTEKEIRLCTKTGSEITVVLSCGSSGFSSSGSSSRGKDGAFTQLWNNEYSDELSNMYGIPSPGR